jgi:hypothetical protein
MRPIAAAIIAAAAVALLAAACSSSPSSTGSGGSPNAGGASSPSLLAFAQCMRSKGVPNFPDPDPSSNGKFPSAQQLGVSDSQYQAAQNACQNLLPVGANDHFPPAEVPQLLVGMRSFSQCMRSHGVTNWPDPTVNSSGQPNFPLSTHGITRGEAHSQQMMATENACSHSMPSSIGGVPIG